jgi:hypothetical protein
MSTETLQRIADKHMVCLQLLVIRPQQNPGVRVVQSPVFLEFLEEELIVLVRELLVTCVEEEECSVPPRPTEDGIGR